MSKQSFKRPFFVVPGSKWKSASSYPRKKYDTIVEPFAGAAGYSCNSPSSKVILVDNDPKITAVWRFLISVSSDDLKALPDLEEGQKAEDLDLPDGAKYLIEFWTANQDGVSEFMLPQLRKSGWLWGQKLREILADQIESIRHWEVIEGDYTKAPDIEATWFIDPPRETIDGVSLREGSDLDYLKLGEWSQSRKGYVIVCEFETADWIPFHKAGTFKGSFDALAKGKKFEAFWESENVAPPKEASEEEKPGELKTPKPRKIRKHELAKKDWKWKLFKGDCLERLKDLPDNSIDAVVTDPPCGISFMGADWDSDKGGRNEWIAWLADVMKECWRVLKPGGHALVWAIPRTSHWTGMALEEAGFEPRDCIARLFSTSDVFREFWEGLTEEQRKILLLLTDESTILHGFGSGFPKSLNVSKAIDEAMGAEREVLGKSSSQVGVGWVKKGSAGFKSEFDITAPATEAAKQWSGFGSLIKPGYEPWWLVRKPLEGTIAENVLSHSTGAINIDGCRVGEPIKHQPGGLHRGSGVTVGSFTGKTVFEQEPHARYPANICHDGSDEVVEQFPVTASNSGKPFKRNEDKSRRTYNKFKGRDAERGFSGDTGPTSRFFYCAKPSKSECNIGIEKDSGNVHPTVKPLRLMRYLCRLITPPGGIVLDPFTGSGTTGVGALLEHFRFIGIEREPEFQEISSSRLGYAERNLEELREKTNVDFPEEPEDTEESYSESESCLVD